LGILLLLLPPKSRPSGGILSSFFYRFWLENKHFLQSPAGDDSFFGRSYSSFFFWIDLCSTCRCRLTSRRSSPIPVRRGVCHDARVDVEAQSARGSCTDRDIVAFRKPINLSLVIERDDSDYNETRHDALLIKGAGGCAV
jgi:hypothetical protein